jgi:uncharacterized protein with HEPN domain
LQDIVIHNFTAMGTASATLPEAFRARFPEVKWARVGSFRNFIVHEYFRTDWAIVLAAADTLPALIPELEKVRAALILEEQASS